ncbi:Neuraminidase (sialidase) [Nicoletella semolina]|uniref:exo-alpha-sialidase n=1 Tax=Nicoletella semolina TaxID=271160 RepID=A0A4R2NCJ8_9PAST|nr:exo-alpha-sialidase [Nicoletella semolina]MDH2924185.1 hypothetical protein [Nicoletella semolina]TCP18919.1 Neuraminidase (sialidase) [Nicoletella semolina]
MKKTSLALLVSSVIGIAYAASDPMVFKYQTTRDLVKPVSFTEQFKQADAFNANSGSFTFRVKNLSATGRKAKEWGYSSLFGIANPAFSSKYVNFYMDRVLSDSFGIEFLDTTQSATPLIPTRNLSLYLPKNNRDFRTITYVFDKKGNKIELYANGELKKTHNNVKFLEDIEGLAKAHLGENPHYGKNKIKSRITGDVYYADFTKEVLTAEQVQQKHQEIENAHRADLAKDSAKREAFGAFMTEKIPLFQSEQHGSKNYRIPALIKTKNDVVIAAIDKRNDHGGDWGNIDIAIRRSVDGGKTWQDDQVVLDLAAQPKNDAYPITGDMHKDTWASFLIDPQMTVDRNTGRVFMLVDMFPEGKGLHNPTRDMLRKGLKPVGDGTGYKTIDGKSYRLLLDKNKNPYTVREGGIVYDHLNQATNYRVVVEGDPNIARRDLGDLYQGDKRLGNIFLQTLETGNDTAPLTIYQTSYLWLTYSDDDGKTWSNPIDLTPQIKEDWMQFVGTGPGNGLQLKNGNLVLPIYYTNANRRQSSALIISSDGGKTWTRGESPNDSYLDQRGGSRLLTETDPEITESQVIELNNGDLKMFSRNQVGLVRVSTSKDGGYTWQKEADFPEELVDSYSQLSIIKYSKLINNKEYVVFANAHSTSRGRVNGKVWLGEVQDNGSIAWKYTTTIDPNSYWYNSLTELPNGDIGILYEEDDKTMQYVSFNLQELLWKDNIIHRDVRSSPKDNPIPFSHESGQAETYYKIGDGEMVKVGTGVNTDKLVIDEGGVLLNQTTDTSGKKQAFAEVQVNAGGIVRLGTADQIGYHQIKLNQGALDLNGHSLTLDGDQSEKSGLYSETLVGQIVNESATPATLTYTAGGKRTLQGKLGNHRGKLDFTYKPHSTGHFTVKGDSHLNKLNLADNALFTLEDGHHTASQTTLGTGAVLSVNADTRFTSINTNTIGRGSLTKTGKQAVSLTGKFAHSGHTHFNEGITEFNGVLENGTLTVANGATLAGNGDIRTKTTLERGSSVEPSALVGETFEANTLRLNDVDNKGATVRLKVENNSTEMANWQYDQLLIQGKLDSEQSIPVDIELLGTQIGVSDKNHNGQYDANEGISLIQVKQGKANQFHLRNTKAKEASFIYPLALIAVEKGLSVTPNNAWDYRLQNQIIDVNGKPIPAVANSNLNVLTRLAVQSRIPSYLVANNAMFAQGDTLRHQFMDNIGEEDRKGFYVKQQHGNSQYRSNLSFQDYGYSYQAKQNSTLFGGYLPFSESLTLHAGIGFSKQKVTPNAVDGTSHANYHTTSFLVGLQQDWDKLQFTHHLGYHSHRGSMNLSDRDNIATVRGKQLHLSGQLGYRTTMDKVTITPTFGLSYDRLNTKAIDHLSQWQVAVEPKTVFSQYIGSQLSVKLDKIRLKTGVFYENRLEREGKVAITAQQSGDFRTGKLGNALLVNTVVDFSLTSRFSLGLQASYRHALGQAKLQQTQISGKLEYRF